MEKQMEIQPGLRVQTIAGEQDTDEHGAERATPPGSWGCISGHNHADHWDLVFPNGTWVVVTEAELSDPTQYKLALPQALEPTATKLVEVHLSALTRVEYMEVIEVPADITQDELNALVNQRYRDVDGGEFTSDPEYWERGTCEAVVSDMPSASPTMMAFRTEHGLHIERADSTTQPADEQTASPSKSIMRISEDGLTVTDDATGLVWDRKHLENRLTWDQAQEAVKAANESSHLGFNDWRLPALDELKGLVKVGSKSSSRSATIDLKAFPGTPAAGFWTGEPYSPVPADAWIVVFNYGYTDAVLKDYGLFVRLVRSGQ